MIGDVEVQDLRGAMNVSYGCLTLTTHSQRNFNSSYGSTTKLEWQDFLLSVVYLPSYQEFRTHFVDRHPARHVSMP
jgi:hypothetical protein